MCGQERMQETPTVSRYQLYFEAIALTNTGPSGHGVIIQDQNGEICRYAEYAGNHNYMSTAWKSLQAGIQLASSLYIEELLICGSNEEILRRAQEMNAEAEAREDNIIKKIEISLEKPNDEVKRLATKALMMKKGEEGESTRAELLDELEGLHILRKEKALLIEGPPKTSEAMEGDEIKTILHRLLGDEAHILHPNTNSVYSIFSEDSMAREKSSIQIALEVQELIKTERNESNTDSENFQYKKPIVMILNTEGCDTKLSQREESKIDDMIYGSHWVAIVILPKGYKVEGVAYEGVYNNYTTRMFFYDSLKSQRKIPTELISALKGETSYQTSDDNTLNMDNIRKLPVCIDGNTLIYHHTEGLQQGNDLSCGWWSIYNSVMTTLTGSDKFMERFAEWECPKERREAGALLERLLPILRQVSSDEMDESSNSHTYYWQINKEYGSINITEENVEPLQHISTVNYGNILKTMIKSNNKKILIRTYDTGTVKKTQDSIE